METTATQNKVTETLPLNRFVELGYNSKGKPTVKHYSIKTSGKNKGDIKVLHAFYFETEAKRTDWMEKLERSLVDQVEKEEAKKKLLAESKNMEHPYKVGSILYASWGYEQTNINFYQVTEVNKSKIVLREIKAERTSYEHRSSTGRKVPLVDQFTKDENSFTKIVKRRVYDEKVSFSVSMEVRGNLYFYDGGDKGVYFSDGY